MLFWRMLNRNQSARDPSVTPEPWFVGMLPCSPEVFAGCFMFPNIAKSHPAEARMDSNTCRGHTIRNGTKQRCEMKDGRWETQHTPGDLMMCAHPACELCAQHLMWRECHNLLWGSGREQLTFWIDLLSYKIASTLITASDSDSIREVKMRFSVIYFNLKINVPHYVQWLCFLIILCRVTGKTRSITVFMCLLLWWLVFYWSYL